MTKLPDDMVDPAEGRFARRIGSYTDQAVFPIDPVSIASSAVVAARRRSVIGRLFDVPAGGGAGGVAAAAARLALIAAGATLVVASIAVVAGGARGLVGPAQTPSDDTTTIAFCTPNEVDAVITAWDGAAGNRIATVELRNTGSRRCSVDVLPQPWLADGGGAHLIDGAAGSGLPITFGPGAVLHTMVDVANYCGADPKAPVTVVFTQGDVRQDPPPPNAVLFVATALSADDLQGVPPCNGPGFPGTIQMHPWAP